MKPSKTKAPLQIVWTDKLDVFQQHGRQRELATNHVKLIQDSIAANGFFAAKPIQCYRDGKSLRVIDGHHRLQAAINAKTGVYYIIVSKDEADSIGVQNSTVRRWNCDAFINFWRLGGNKHFIVLQEYIDKGLPSSVAGAALLGQSSGVGGNQSYMIANGTWKVRSTETADILLKIMQRLDGIAVSKTTAFLNAVLSLLNLPQFDVEWMIQRFEKYPAMLERRSNRDQMLEVIEEAYNYGKREKINLAFLAKEMLRARKETNLTRGRVKK